MLRHKKNREEMLEELSRIENDCILKLFDLEKKFDEKYQDLEVALNKKYLNLDKTLRENNEKDRDELESNVSGWCSTEEDRANVYRAKQDQMIVDQKNHMNIVEQTLNQQLTFLKDISDCLKTIVISKMKGVKRVPNDTN